MKGILDAYSALYTWQTGIPIAFNAAIAISVIVYTTSTSTYMRLKLSLNRGVVGFVLAYIYVLLLIVSKLNIDSMWWRDENLRNNVAWILALIIGIITAIISIISLWKYTDPTPGTSVILAFLSFVILGLIFTFIYTLFFMVTFAVGDFFFINIHYILYIAALIGLPTLSIVAGIFIFSKLKHPGLPLTVFCYLTISACAASMHFLSLAGDITQKLNPNAIEIVNQIRSFFRYMSAYLSPIFLIIGPFLLMIVIFYFRQTIGTWVGCICGLFAVTSIQLIMVKSPLFDNIRNLFRTSDLTMTWILIIYTVSTASVGAYYLWTLSRKRIEKKVENLHPLLAIGAIVLNVCFLYPVVVSSEPLLWAAWYTSINLLIGLIILFGRLRVLSRKNDRMDIR
jgi:hypothetical protein